MIKCLIIAAIYVLMGLAVSVAGYVSNLERDGDELVQWTLFWPVFLPILAMATIGEALRFIPVAIGECILDKTKTKENNELKENKI